MVLQRTGRLSVPSMSASAQGEKPYPKGNAEERRLQATTPHRTEPARVGEAPQRNRLVYARGKQRRQKCGVCVAGRPQSRTLRVSCDDPHLRQLRTEPRTTRLSTSLKAATKAQRATTPRNIREKRDLGSQTLTPSPQTHHCPCPPDRRDSSEHARNRGRDGRGSSRPRAGLVPGLAHARRSSAGRGAELQHPGFVGLFCFPSSN